MKKYLLLIGFILMANMVFADCFIDGSRGFLTLENKKVKEILGLTSEEVSNSEVYKEVFSHIKERFSIDIENDIKQITIYSYYSPNNFDFMVVINGDFDSEKIQSNIKKLIDSEKWSYHKFTDYELCGNKYQALKLERFNIVFYDKNTLIFCIDSVQGDKSLKITKTPDNINKLKKISNNYLYFSKDFLKEFGIGLEKSDYLISYINNKELTIEAAFNDPSDSKKLVETINNIISNIQIETLNQNLKEDLERIKEEYSKSEKGFISNILYFLFESLYPSNMDLFSNLRVIQSENIVKLTCDFNNILAGVTSKLLFDIKDIIGVKERAFKNSDLSKQVMNYSEESKTIYSNNLQKIIDEHKQKLNKSSFADTACISALLYLHLEAKKLIDSIDISLGEKDNIAFLKNKFDTIYITRAIAFTFLSAIINIENDGKYIDFATLIDRSNKNSGISSQNATVEDNPLIKKMCFTNQRVIFGAVEIYNIDHKEKPMTSLDIPFLIKETYLKESYLKNTNCEYYLEGNLTEGIHIGCKIHGCVNCNLTFD